MVTGIENLEGHTKELYEQYKRLVEKDKKVTIGNADYQVEEMDKDMPRPFSQSIPFGW